MKRGSQKAVSPLIATVLLVGFAIILAVLVFTWWNNLVRERAAKVGAETESQLSCALHLDFQVRNICYDANGRIISISLENSGSVLISGFKIVVTGTLAGNNVQEVFPLNDEFAEGTAKETSVTYDPSHYDPSTPFTQIELIPLVISRGAESVCTEKSIMVNTIAAC